MSVYVIAEAGVNHNGSLAMALELVNAAAAAGADAVKFQTFKAKNLVTNAGKMAEYQVRNTSNEESQQAMLERLELDVDAHDQLIARAKEKNIAFLSTPFDEWSLDLLVNRFGLRSLKVSSGDLTNAPFLLEIARRAEHVILSTGMATLSEIEFALSVVAFGLTSNGSEPSGISCFSRAYCSLAGQKALRERVTVLHCTTEYPAPVEDVNLRAMDTIAAAFPVTVGYSDHTKGIHIPVAAVARGAAVIEKHFTLDKTLPGPDHLASLDVQELAAMVHAIREVEESLGDSVKIPRPSEMPNRDIARKSLVAKAAIKSGDVFSAQNLTSKRPGQGLSPTEYWRLLGKPSTRDYVEDDLIDE
jgi:N-acetylneuraminate synthase